MKFIAQYLTKQKMHKIVPVDNGMEILKNGM